LKNGFIPQLKLIDGVDNIALKVGAAGWAIFQYSASIQTLLEKNVTISNDLLAGAISLPLFQIVSWKTALPI